MCGTQGDVGYVCVEHRVMWDWNESGVGFKRVVLV